MWGCLSKFHSDIIFTFLWPSQVIRVGPNLFKQIYLKKTTTAYNYKCPPRHCLYLLSTVNITHFQPKLVKASIVPNSLLRINSDNHCRGPSRPISSAYWTLQLALYSSQETSGAKYTIYNTVFGQKVFQPWTQKHSCQTCQFFDRIH